MWIASKIGFFSIVEKDGSIQVRGRSRDDLEHLVALAGVIGPEVLEGVGTDYQVRVLVDRDQFERIMLALADQVDYPNFKNEIARIPAQRPKLGAYHGLWEALARLVRV